MALRGNQTRWVYSGATTVNDTQGDPALSLGGNTPLNTDPAASSCYRQTSINADATVPNEFVWDPTDSPTTPAIHTPAVGSWAMIVQGAAGGSYGKVIAIDTPGTNLVTLDRPLSALPLTGDFVRFSNDANLFPNVAPADLVAGFVDYRLLFMLKSNIGGENNFRFYIDPIKPNGCDLKLYGGSVGSGGGGAGYTIGSIADARTSPFSDFDQPVTDDLEWAFAEAPDIYYGDARTTPLNGTGAIAQDAFVPIWIERTIPASAKPGECVFALNISVPDAVSQDAGADPNPFLTGAIISWTIPEPAYVLTVTQDRTVYVDGGARIIGTVTDSNGNPVIDLNCWLEIDSGPGSIATALDGRTDANGRIEAIYTAPSTISTDPVIRLVVPTTPGF